MRVVPVNTKNMMKSKVMNVFCILITYLPKSLPVVVMRMKVENWW